MTKWKIYLLDDAPVRHKLVVLLVKQLNENCNRSSYSHEFQIGFNNVTLDEKILSEAIRDPEGIWLVDLHIPIDGKGDLDLAKHMLNQLQEKGRSVLLVSSGKIPAEEFDDIHTAWSIKAVSLKNDSVAEVAKHVMALAIPEQIYAQRFTAAFNRLQLNSYHTQVNGGVPVAMFQEGVMHNLSDWDSKYSDGVPTEELTSIQSCLSDLFDTWGLDLTLLVEHSDWWVPAAKAVNGSSIHRAFLLGIIPPSTKLACDLGIGRLITNRNIREPIPHKGLRGLQTLLRSPNNGDRFVLEACNDWNDDGTGDCGIELLLRSSREGCEANTHFTQILEGAWVPDATMPNSSETSRALHSVRDAFMIDGSAVTCDDNRIVIRLRLLETKMA